MDKKIKKHEQTDRADKLTVTKDNGDLKRNINELIKRNADYHKTYKVYLPDRGDSEKKLTINQNKIKPHVDKKQSNDNARFLNAERSVTVALAATQKDLPVKKNKEKSDVLRTHQKHEERCNKEKYTLRLKNIDQTTTNLTQQDDYKVESVRDGVKSAGRRNRETKEYNRSIEKPPTKSNEGQSEHAKCDKDSLRTQRKPIIKTVKLKNDPHLYKAVTFVDQKKSPTPLQIKIPNGVHRKQKVSKTTDTSSLKCKIKATVSRVSVKENSVNRRRIDKKLEKEYTKKHFPSPDSSVTKSSSPPTEVAKWAPSCINRHTKPYYEAWVNTTLAAISKTPEDEIMLTEKQNIIDSFKKEFQRPETPELIYENIADERYTGRIKVTQRT